MRRPVVIVLLLVAILLVEPMHVLYAWNPTAHRVISSIAYRQLDPKTRQRVAEILHKHPARAELWANRPTNGPDDVLNLLWNAGLFADDARVEPWKKYSRPQTHYVNYRLLTQQGNTVEPPVAGENILASYQQHLAILGNPATSDEDRALSLSWVFHQVGDIHQPLHSVARFSKALPNGDRGGNEVKLTNPRAMAEWGQNLHAYWDDLLGQEQDPAAIEKMAQELIEQFPSTGFVAELGKTRIEDWAEESMKVSLSTVYPGLDPEVTKLEALPAEYEARAVQVARRRVALAGYRLAKELERLAGPPGQ